MLQATVQEVENNFAEYLTMLEDGTEDSIMVPRAGDRCVMIVLAPAPVTKRIGVAKGKFRAPEDFDANAEEAAAMLTEGAL